MSTNRLPISTKSWIVQEKPWFRNGPTCRPLRFASDLLPPLFESYAKILHATAAYDVEPSFPWSPGEVVRWSSFADRLGLSIPQDADFDFFGLELFDRDDNFEWIARHTILGWQHILGIWAVEEGALPDTHVKRIADLAFGCTGDTSLRWHYEEIQSLDDWSNDVGEGQVDDLLAEMSTKHGECSPELMWSPAQSWCLCTDTDTEWSIVGGPKEFIKSLIDDELLEAIPVNPDEPVTSESCDRRWNEWRRQKLNMNQLDELKRTKQFQTDLAHRLESPDVQRWLERLARPIPDVSDFDAR